MNNSLNGTSVTTAQLLMNNDSNYSNFTFKNSTISNTKYSHLQTRNFNSNNSLSHTDSLENINYNVDNNNNSNSNNNTSNPYNHYIKLTNDDIISKIKLKLTASTQNILSNNNNNNTKSQIANDKEDNNISFENENVIQTPTKQQSNTKPKHRKPTNQVIQKQHNKQQFNNSINNNNSKCFISSASKTKDLSQFVNSDYMYIKNALGNSPVASSSVVIKENGCLFSNRTLSGKRHKKKHKISNSIDVKSNNKSHLNELSITTESTFSSKRNYRNKSNQNRLNSKHTNETTPNEDTEAKERTKIFYKNIKNIKSKYNSFINSNGNSNNNTHLLSSNEPSKFASNTNEKYFQMKGLHLEQYINTKLN